MNQHFQQKHIMYSNVSEEQDVQDEQDEQDEQNEQNEASFYSKLLKLQQQYHLNSSETTLQQLIKYYSDCILYFDKQQEGISTYFQHKLKKMMLLKRKTDKQRRISQQLQNNTKHIPIAQQIKNHTQSATKYQQKIASIIDKQKHILSERSRKLRKASFATGGFSASLDSLFQSSTPRSLECSNISLLKTSLFQSLIKDQNCSQQSN